MLDAGSERIVVVVDADHSHILNAGEDISRARHKIVLHPDLERIAPSALEHALVESIGRPLTYQEKQKLESWIKLGAKEFEGRIADEWNVYLKRQSVPKNAIAFSTYLAKYFPERQPNTPWERVWEACYRLLLLGT